MTDLTLGRIATGLFATSVALLAGTVVLGVLQLVRGIPLPANAASSTSGLLFLAAGLIYCTVGALIARRQPRNTIGWLLLIVATSFAAVTAVSTYADWVVGSQPSASEQAALAYALFAWLWVPAVGLMGTFVVLLFPDGHLPSPRWRWLAWLCATVLVTMSLLTIVDPQVFADTVLAGVANPLAIDLPVRVTGDEVFLVLLACMVLSAAAAVSRYRRAGGVERLQLKWLATASVFFVCFFVLAEVIAAAVPGAAQNELAGEVIHHLLPLAFCAFPLAIAAAVLRYRLYEIDVVINRALVVAALSSFITGVYVAIVVGVGQLAGLGNEPDLALSIAATAVVAVAFQPVRERVQRWANRLVYGERATPYEVLSRFAERMGGAYDASELLPVMARTIGQGVGAVRVDVWLRSDSGFERAASWHGEAGAGAVAASRSGLSGDRIVPVLHREELLGAVAVTMRTGEGLSPAEDRLLRDVAAQAGLVLRNVRLIQDLRASRQRLVTSQDEERRRLERNLHDGAQQSLVALTLMLRMTRSRLTAVEAGAALDRAGDELQQAITELRELARGIYPAVLAERGLGPALTSLAERSPVPVVVEDQVSGRLPNDVERTFYFVAAEALAGATAGRAQEVELRVAQPSGAATLEVRGDHVGDGDDELIWLRDRVAVVDGTVTTSPIGSPGGRSTNSLLFTVPVRHGREQPDVTGSRPATMGGSLTGDPVDNPLTLDGPADSAPAARDTRGNPVTAGDAVRGPATGV